MPRVSFTNLDRVFWPEADLRKADLVAYYRAVAPVLVPHLRGRPFTIKRHYIVPRGPFEWGKDAPAELPGWIKTCPQPAKSRPRGELVRYPLVNSEAALFWMVEYGAVDLHVWTSRCNRPDRPDYLLFDLDPAAGSDFDDAMSAALLFREARTAPELVTTEARRERRRGVYVDTKMNGQGQQIVCGYSVRPLPGARVATPLRWEELRDGLDPGGFTLRTVPSRLARVGDLHAGLLRGRQRLDLALARLTST